MKILKFSFQTFYKTFSREASPEAAAWLKATLAVELRDDGDCKFSGSDSGEKCLDLGYIWIKYNILSIHFTISQTQMHLWAIMIGWAMFLSLAKGQFEK